MLVRFVAWLIVIAVGLLGGALAFFAALVVLAILYKGSLSSPQFLTLAVVALGGFTGGIILMLRNSTLLEKRSTYSGIADYVSQHWEQLVTAYQQIQCTGCAAQLYTLPIDSTCTVCHRCKALFCFRCQSSIEHVARYKANIYEGLEVYQTRRTKYTYLQCPKCTNRETFIRDITAPAELRTGHDLFDHKIPQLQAFFSRWYRGPDTGSESKYFLVNYCMINWPLEEIQKRAERDPEFVKQALRMRSDLTRSRAEIQKVAQSTADEVPVSRPSGEASESHGPSASNRNIRTISRDDVQAASWAEARENVRHTLSLGESFVKNLFRRPSSTVNNARRKVAADHEELPSDPIVLRYIGERDQLISQVKARGRGTALSADQLAEIRAITQHYSRKIEEHKLARQ